MDGHRSESPLISQTAEMIKEMKKSKEFETLQHREGALLRSTATLAFMWSL